MNPLLFVVADDDTLGGELASRFARDYTIETVSAVDGPIDRLRVLHAAGSSVAVVLAVWDSRGHQGGGSDALSILGEVRDVVPTAVRLAVGDRRIEAGTPELRQAIVLGRIDAALARPSGPRDEEFFGALTDYLADWAWTTQPSVETVRIVGAKEDPDVRAMTDALRRHAIPTGVHAPDSLDGGRILEQATPGATLPVVQILDEPPIASPTLQELADQFGFPRDVASRTYDLAVVGAGPAGLGAAVYGASEGLATIVIEKEAIGGQAGTSSMIRNYLGFPRGVTGRRLGMRAGMQAARFGAAFHLMRSVEAIRPDGDLLRLSLSSGIKVSARSVLVSTGVSYRRLGVAALEALIGSGVFYGPAAGEAQALEGLRAYVVGAGNSAGQATMHLARYAAHVTLVVRGTDLSRSMSDYLVGEILAHDRITVCTRTEVVDGGGHGHLEWLILRDTATGRQTQVTTAGLFVLIGAEPSTEWLPGAIQRDARGFIRTGADLSLEQWPLARRPAPFETSMPGVFAAGDVRAGSVKRVAAAAGEGAVTVPLIHELLRPG